MGRTSVWLPPFIVAQFQNSRYFRHRPPVSTPWHLSTSITFKSLSLETHFVHAWSWGRWSTQADPLEWYMDLTIPCAHARYLCQRPCRQSVVLHTTSQNALNCTMTALSLHPSSALAGVSTFLLSITNTKASTESAQQCCDITAQLRAVSRHHPSHCSGLAVSQDAILLFYHSSLLMLILFAYPLIKIHWLLGIMGSYFNVFKVGF